MGQVSNRFFVTSIKDGTVLSAVIYSSATLTQLVSKDGSSSTPDWTGNGPDVYCIVRAGGTPKVPSISKWYINGTEITFPANPVSGTTLNNNTGSLGGAFQYKLHTLTEGGNSFQMPGLKIYKNIATYMNQDNDVLTCTGTVEYNGAQIEFTASTTIRISKFGGSGFFGWISGDSYVTKQDPSVAGGKANMYAHLTNGTASVTTDFKTRWFREGVTPSGRWVSSGLAGTIQTIDNEKVSYCYIAGNEITDYVVLRCDFFDATATDAQINAYYSGGSNAASCLFSAYWDVDDMEDEEEMYIFSYSENNVKNGVSVCLREDQEALMVAYMGKRSDSSIVDARYTSFKCKLLNHEGVAIASNSPAGNLDGLKPKGATPSGNVTFDSDGFFDITVSNITQPLSAAKAGKVAMTAAFVDRHGGAITGIIKATS